jgi:hypothetical protein
MERISLMKISNASKYILGIFAAAGILAGCSGSQAGMAPSSGMNPSTIRGAAHGKAVNVVPDSLLAKTRVAFHGRVAPASKNLKGIYASEFEGADVYGYARQDKKNNASKCSIGGVGSVNDIATDKEGNLIVPDAFDGVEVYSGPGMCGTLLGTITDSFGQAADAASSDAATGTIVVGNIFDEDDAPASISVCTLTGGCTTNLTNSNIEELAGVAIDKNGDCWGDAVNDEDEATLTYFAGCSGAGEATTGFENSSYGGLDIDKDGNLVTIDLFADSVYVYSGCNPACTLVSGPLPLHGEAVFGHLDKRSGKFVAGDVADGALDIYKYTPTSLTYEYSITSGLSPSLDVEGAAFNPESKQ